MAESNAADLTSDISISNVTYNSSPTTILGNVFFNICFFQSGKLRGGQLKNDTTINDVTYTSGLIFYYENAQVERGSLVFGSNQVIDDVTYVGGRRIYFFDNGQSKQGFLGANEMIDGVTYYAGNWIRFNSDGSFHSSYINQDTNLFSIF